ncbi:MAG TPA: zinc-dependent alcohol dehydrogenase family protein [Kofleriaceae bacterium]|nr:zinc-dependent alcohol dehydrogenase family protein [Kofleriaceae bacterium]
MRAMVLDRPGDALHLRELPDPEPGPGQIRIRVAACGVCRTDLHIVDGELARPALPLVPGHQIVGRVDRIGDGASRFAHGDRVGVPWLGRACGVCRFCRSGRENLCDAPVFTGYTRDGGFAELAVADADFALPLADSVGDDADAAPLLCAGAIGYRALRIAGDGARLGLWGFGAAAHIIIQIALHQGREVYVFTRPGDAGSQEFARALGATWAGGSDGRPPVALDASILFAPVGALVPAALACADKGGRVVCAGIHMSDVPSFPYELLWNERSVVSVANLTRQDGADLLAAAARSPIRTHVTRYPLADANRALSDVRAGRLDGAAVLVAG